MYKLIASVFAKGIKKVFYFNDKSVYCFYFIAKSMLLKSSFIKNRHISNYPRLVYIILFFYLGNANSFILFLALWQCF